MSATYAIIRFYSDGRPSKTIREDLTLAEAQEHCSYDDSEGLLEDGTQWFDGFEKE